MKLGLTALLTCTLTLAACARSAAPASPTGVPAAQVVRQSSEQVINSSGEVRAPAQVSVQPQATGRVQQVLVDVGANVRAGDTLARLDDESAQIGVLQARANLAAAQAKLQMVQAGARPDDV